MNIFIEIFVFEIATLLVRFGFGVSARDFFRNSPDNSAFPKRISCLVRRWTGEYRIHHGYVGVVFMGLGAVIANSFLVEVGAILFWSDVLHHTFLFFLMGDAEFDVTYEQTKRRMS